MNQEIKKQWLADLRDGTRTQGHGYLRDEDGRQCCLDVLCEQAVRAGIIGPPVLVNNGGTRIYQYEDKYGNHDIHYLPSVVAEWAGLTNRNCSMETNPVVMTEEGKTHLADLNDAKYATFEEIAYAIDNSL